MNKINLNDCVYVELNERGWELVEKYYKELYAVFPKDYLSNVKDSVEMHKAHTKSMIIDDIERNVTEFQLHNFMLVFGKHAHCGAENFIEGNDVWFIGGIDNE